MSSPLPFPWTERHIYAVDVESLKLAHANIYFSYQEPCLITPQLPFHTTLACQLELTPQSTKVTSVLDVRQKALLKSEC